jgi:hypothetical protein
VALNNGLKGYVPSVVQEGASMIVADDSKHAELVRRGYTRIADYQGDRLENYRGRRGVYQSAVSGPNAFRQGAAQTVHATYQGVDLRTGINRTRETAGVLLGAQARLVAARRNMAGVRNDLAAGNHLLPIFNADGKIVGYQRPMAPEHLSRLNRDTHLGRMLGVWSGRN